ncbi:bifunctional DNA primase/polymerase [Glycomyces sp. L485]|uniref:bifunctional DNA primase/polymerase n=1 Tax=Glycomyces sp. L485 TaxID=2909235 RepID=UPI001F4A934A|nr:bifunctional DNA primase/polymerase [Glycomyces sp. L485]MCH7230203.1 bifunctional DNA primase/polymerase [Glycomyces sp. L485]
MTTNDLLTAALAAARRGWPIFPLAVGGKRPAIKRWEERATTDPERIERCWSAGEWNIGLACGPAGLVVVDLDRPKGGQERYNPDGSIYTGAVGYDALAAEAGGASGFGETFTVATPSGGWHLYFTRPAGIELRNTASGLAYLVDTRAVGGYVVAPGSRTDAGTYTAVHTGEVAPLPDWLAQRLKPVERPQHRAVAAAAPGSARLRRAERRSARLERYLAAAIDRETAAVAAAHEGGRNHRLYCAAVALGQLVAGGYLTEPDAAGPLTEAAAASGLSVNEIARTIASGLTAGAKTPRTLPAETTDH